MRFWIRQEADRQWTRVPIPPQGLSVLASPGGGIDFVARARSPVARVVPFTENGVERAALIAAPSAGRLWVNGCRPVADLHVLEDRDEIALAGHLFYYTAADDVEVVDLPNLGAEMPCPRCTGILHEGDRAVSCPVCKAWHHEGKLADATQGERLCWSYDQRCASCQRLRERLLWHPEDLDD